MSRLFSTFRLRDLSFRNRVFIPPMCQYSSQDGFPTHWHLVHAGARAVGGAACFIQEATAVTPDGRISPADAGIWNDAQAASYMPINRFLEENGCVPGIQLAHAGRKASTSPPWFGTKPVPEAEGGWPVVGPSPLPFSASAKVPRELRLPEIAHIIEAFKAAAIRALAAGFKVAEVHAAHGYLLHEFLSPLSNARKDAYGGSFENRTRLTIEVCKTVREIWPQHLPVFARISATDWTDGGWGLPDSIVLCRMLREIGIDLIDVSTGGNVPGARIPVERNYQTRFAGAIRTEASIPTGAVGLIIDARQAEDILRRGEADVVLVGRAALRDPNWPNNAARALETDPNWPNPYARVSELEPHERGV